jgi:hypothetical protein
MQSVCKAITKQNKPCTISLEPWRTTGLCHVHDPNGKFRKQQSKKKYKDHTKISGCKHTWYMRDPGITCTICGEIWEKD